MEIEEYIMRIEEIERLRLKRYAVTERSIIEALREDKSVDPSLLDSSGIKERYLEALEVYGRFGLTPQELYEKRIVWLWRPSEGQGTTRVKTISTFLGRLHHARLADRRKEGRVFRYFINMRGKRRLRYYKDQRKESKVTPHDRLLFAHVVLNSVVVGNIRDMFRMIEEMNSSSSLGFYSFFWERVMLELFDSLFFLQMSILLGGEKTERFAIMETTKSLMYLQEVQKQLLAVVLSNYMTS